MWDQLKKNERMIIRKKRRDFFKQMRSSKRWRKIRLLKGPTSVFGRSIPLRSLDCDAESLARLSVETTPTSLERCVEIIVISDPSPETLSFLNNKLATGFGMYGDYCDDFNGWICLAMRDDTVEKETYYPCVVIISKTIHQAMVWLAMYSHNMTRFAGVDFQSHTVLVPLGDMEDYKYVCRYLLNCMLGPLHPLRSKNTAVIVATELDHLHMGKAKIRNEELGSIVADEIEARKTDWWYE